MAPLSRPSSKRQMVQEIRYRDIPAGEGGVLTFSNDDLTHVGTVGCFTCIGVYMPITSTSSEEASRAFCAHINPYIWSTCHKVAVRGSFTPEEGAKIKLQTLQKLRASARKQGWDPSDVDTTRTIIVCPKYLDDFHDDDENGEQRKKLGFYVVDAIQEFLGRPQGLVCDSSSEGFIVNHSTGQVDKVRSNVITKEERNMGEYGVLNKRFERVEEKPGEDWKVFVRRFDGGSTYADAAYRGLDSD